MEPTLHRTSTMGGPSALATQAALRADPGIIYPVEDRVGLAFTPWAYYNDHPEKKQIPVWQVQTDDPNGAMRSPSRRRREWHIRGAFAGGRHWLFTARPGMDWRNLHRGAARMIDTRPDYFEIIYQGPMVIPHEFIPGDSDRIELRWQNL